MFSKKYMQAYIYLKMFLNNFKIMSFARDVMLEVPCTGPVPGTLKDPSLSYRKEQGKPGQ